MGVGVVVVVAGSEVPLVVIIVVAGSEVLLVVVIVVSALLVVALPSELRLRTHLDDIA